MGQILPYLFAISAAYLLGSIPTGYLVARVYGNVDLLSHGSRKTGTTNVLRTLGWKAAALVFTGDFAKGSAAIVLARLISQGDPVADLLAGLAVILGHAHSVYIGFKGGRGVATGLGTLLIIAPVAMAIAVLLATTVIALSRYVSLGSILGACVVPVLLLILTLTLGQPIPHFVYALIGSLFVLITHRDNIGRLLSGTERKLGDRARP